MCGSRVCTADIGLCFSNGYSGDLMTPLVAQMVKNLPEEQGPWVRSLGWEDPLEEAMATHSSIVAWRIPWTEKPGGLQSTGSQRVGQTERLSRAHSTQAVSLPSEPPGSPKPQ